MRELNEQEQAAIAEAHRVLITVVEGLRAAIILALPILLRLFCVVTAVIGAALSFSAAWSAYGGDIVALIPASMIALLPLALVLALDLRWGGIVGAGVLGLVLSQVLPLLPLAGHALLVAAVIGTCIAIHLFKPKEGTENETRQ